MWRWDGSPLGPMLIVKTRDQYTLFINYEPCGPYSSAKEAARCVYLHYTNFYPWDKLSGAVHGVPEDLSGWKKV